MYFFSHWKWVYMVRIEQSIGLITRQLLLKCGYMPNI